MSESQPEVVIVGGGISGAAAARWLAPDHDVRLLERDRIAGEATGHASGLVSIAADYAQTPALARYALEFFDAGHDGVEYTQRPNVWLVTPDEADDARSEARQLTDAGLDVGFRAADALETAFPGVFDTSDYAGGVVYPGGWVDPASLCHALLDDARDDGARVETGVEVDGLVVERRDVVGVENGTGPIRAETVVVAAGWRSRDLVAPVAELPLRPFRYQTVNLAVERELGPTYPIGWEHDTHLYWRPEANGELHVGGRDLFRRRLEPTHDRHRVVP